MANTIQEPNVAQFTIFTDAEIGLRLSVLLLEQIAAGNLLDPTLLKIDIAKIKIASEQLTYIVSEAQK